MAKTKFIIYSDDDDIWDKNKAELTIESLKTSKVVCHEFSQSLGVLIKSLDFFLEENLKLYLLVIFYLDQIFLGEGLGLQAKRNILNISI